MDVNNKKIALFLQVTGFCLVGKTSRHLTILTYESDVIDVSCPCKIVLIVELNVFLKILKSWAFFVYLPFYEAYTKLFEEII